MFIPMETLSFTATRTDSGSGVRKPTGSGIENGGSRFERMFEEELAKYDSQRTRESPNTEKSEKDVRPVEQRDTGKDRDNTEEALIAGAMGTTQNEVIIILEGESNSITTPEMRIENNVQPPDTEQIVNPDIENEANPEIDTKTFTAPTPENAQATATTTVETTANAATAETTAKATTETAATVTAEPIATAAAETAKPIVSNETIGENSANATGEVLARMPEIRTHDSQNNTEQSSEFKGNGNLSPLENENDETQVKGQSTYTETANAVRSAAEDQAEIASNEILQAPPPLSEGIKPEQFQANQQMTQAALNTPVKPENLFSEMISRVEMMQSEAKSTMTIQLNPEFLGKVALEVAVDAAGLHVRINAEDSGVRSMINGQLATLIESLEHKGIEVVEVEVAYTGTNLGTYQDPREGGEQHSSRQYTAKRETSTAEQIAFYTTMPDLMDYYLDTGVSSVEYRA